MSLLKLSLFRAPCFIQKLGCLRLMSRISRKDCAVDESPRCSPENIEKNRSKCNIERINEMLASTYFKQECCGNPCPDAMPRFDDLYYKASNKMTRKYTKTWKDCPKQRIRPKKICEYDPSNLPPIIRRTPKDRKAATCDVAESKCEPHGTCPRTTVKPCRPARIPPKCYKTRTPLNCTKVCAPYPSYSECERDPDRKTPAVECGCLKITAFCPFGAPKPQRPNCK